MIQKVNKLASYATYRQLYNDGKKDTYFIISKFIEHIILDQNLNKFDLKMISSKLNENFGFLIPSYVVQSALNRIDYIEKKDNSYRINSNKDMNRKSEITSELEVSSQNSEILTKKLMKYIQQINRDIQIDKDKLIREFSSFLLDDSLSGEYSSIISSFIIDNETDKDFVNIINQIKEGAVLFSGLNYTSDISKLAWQNDIILYVETEILFHLAGYNGTFFKTLASDMFQLINEMNQKSKRRVITVKYFEEVHDDIEKFFGTAEEIVKGHKHVDIGNVAMEDIIEDCKTTSDVIMKRAKFNKLLKDYSISQASSENYYSKEFHEFNIESKDIIEKYDLSTDNKEKYLKHLNYTSILRGRDRVDPNNLNMKDSKHIVVTEVGKILQMSKYFNEKSDSISIPLAINMYILTNRLWFDLNKGFGSEQLPSTFNALEKSRLILSNILTQRVSEGFDKVKESFDNGEISEDDLNENIILLRQIIKRPEEIHKELLDDIDKILTPDKLVIYKSDKEELKKKVKELEQDKHSREQDKLKEMEARKLAEKEVENSKKEITRISNERIEQIQRSINDIETRKDNADKKVKGRIKFIRGLTTIVLILIVLLFIYLGNKWNFDILTYIITIFPLIVIIITIYTGQEFESLNIVNKMLYKTEEYFKSKVYKEYNINLEELEKLKMDLINMNTKESD